MKSHASMNRIYRLVWNAALRIWVAVAENAKGRGKGGSGRSSVDVRSVNGASVNAAGDGFSLSSLCRAALTMLGAVALSSAFTAQAHAADAANAAVTAGSGSVSTAGVTTTINQASQRLAIDWTKLSTASNEALVFAQPNAQAIALNRITGSSPSSFLGSLSANGQVFILNPNGMLFGAGSQVNVGGLVASTLSMSNADFMAGNNTLTKTTGTGSVVNQGTLASSKGGYIALLAPEVRNDGTITATLGTALLAAGNKVTLNLNNGSLLGYSIDEGALKALADNKQLIQADGGQVILSAKAFDALSSATVNNTGIIEAKTLNSVSGRILLMGDMAVGTVNVAGTLDASAPTTGNGGFVETSAAHVKVANAAAVTTAAAHGLTGSWLIDPQDYTVAATGGDITGAALSSSLANNNVTVQSTGGTTAGNGDIFVNDAVSWSAATKLTLNAQRNININQSITAQNANGSLALLYGQGAPFYSNTAAYNVNAPVNLQAGNNFSTQLGSDGAPTAYKVITSLGAPGSITKTDLQGMAGSLSTNYVLGSNIDAALTTSWNGGAGFAPVSNGSTTSFSGTFDGLGHSISNLTINRPTTVSVGMFGYGSRGSVIRNVGLVGARVSGGSYTGGLMGILGGSISNSYAAGSVSGSGNFVGGLVGYNVGSISKSYSAGVVSSNGYYVGGLVGNNTGSVSNSYATGGISGTGNLVGGLVGGNNGSVSNSYATGSVTGSSYIGGLVGLEGSSASRVSNSYATGAVSGTNTTAPKTGGLIGVDSYNSATNSYWDTTTTQQASSAGGAGAVGLSSLLQTASTFTGWSISNAGGSGQIWRIYEGQTAPLLTSFLGNLALSNTTVTYNGTSQSGAGAGIAAVLGTSGRNAGSYSAYSNQQGYDITGGKLIINKAALSIAAVSDSKAYDGNTNSAGVVAVTGLAISDTITGLSQSFSNKNATNPNSNTLAVNSGYIVNDGNNNGGNYTVTINTATGSITPKQLGANLTAQNKIYDGSNGATVMITPTGLVTGETVTATATGTFNSRDVAAAIVVTANSVTLADGTGPGGGLASNYSLAAGETANANITAKALSATASASNKVYDGSTAATPAPILAIASAGFVNSETVTATATGSFNFKDVLTANLVTVNSTTLIDGTGAGGGKASNYSLAAGQTANANITVRNLTVGITGINKVYDGSAAATVVYTDNRISGDNLSFIGNSSFADKTAANGKAVTASAIAVSGSNSANYSANTTANTTANISKAALTVTAQAVSKTYDGTTTATGNGVAGVLAGVGAGESINTAGVQAFLDRNVGTANKTVRASGLTVKDAGNLDITSNYAISYADNTASTISPAVLAVTANAATRLYGAANPALTGNVTGFVNTDTLANATTGTEVFSTAASAASNVGNYAINGAGLSANNGNYVFTQAASNSAALSVTPAALSIAANSASKLADGTAYTGGNGVVYSGFVGAETAAVLAGSLKYGGSSQGASAAGSYAIAPSGLSASNYALTYVNGALTIKPGSVDITALGGPVLVAAYDSVLSQVSKPLLADESNTGDGKAGKNNNGNGNGNNKDKSDAASNSSMATLKGCGVAMPAGFDGKGCQ